MASRMVAGSAMRPKPNSPQAISPSSGPTKRMPSARSVARFRCVAGCSHMRTFMAGATSTRLVGGEQDGGGEIVGEPMRHLGQKVGGRGRDHDQIGLARQADMPDLGLVLEVEQIGEGLSSVSTESESGVTNSAPPFVRIARTRRAPLLQAAHELEALIGGDAAADDREDALALHVVLSIPAASSCRR